MLPTSLPESYLPVLLTWMFAITNATGIIVAGYVLGKKIRNKAKDTPYECGITPTGSAKERFSVKFYLVAMLFILFDIEAVFLYPWAVVYRDLKWFGFVEMLLFVVLVLAGFFYIWKKGVLDWSQAEEVERKAAAGLLLRTDNALKPEKVTHVA
jgi:NADH-quinone oxidoreductase subunit A